MIRFEGKMVKGTLADFFWFFYWFVVGAAILTFLVAKLVFR